MDRSRAYTLAILLGGIAILSTGSIFALLAALPPLLTAFLRCLMAVALLGAWTAAAKRGTKMSQSQALLGVASGVFLGAHLGTWIASMSMTSVAASLALLSTAPVWSFLLGVLLRLEPFRLSQAGAVACSLAGVGLVAWSLGGGGATWQGGALGLASGLAMGCYTLCARARDGSVSLESYALVSYATAGAVLGLSVLAFGQGSAPVTWASLGWVAAMALCSQVVGHTVVNWGAGKLGATTAGQALLLEPVVASLLAWLIFGQSLGPLLAAGAVFILLGALWSLNQKPSDPA